MVHKKPVLWEVDVQEDFMLPEGKLYVPGAEKIIPNIKLLVSAASDKHAFIVSSGDSHPEGDPEFKTFPPHCLRGSPGSRIIPEGMSANFCTIPNDPSFQIPRDLRRLQQIVLEKQTLDVFDNPHASEIVERMSPDAEFIVFGVVTEYCVRCAAKGLLERGRKVAVVSDAIETLKPEEGKRTLDELQRLGALLITTDQALSELLR
jgi:nicotinamidase/pyrazinamidase